MVTIKDVLIDLGNKTPTPFSHLYEELIGPLPERTHPLDQNLNLNLPSAARETAMKALSLPIPEPSILARKRSVPQSTPLQAEKKKAKLQSSDNGNS